MFKLIARTVSLASVLVVGVIFLPAGMFSCLSAIALLFLPRVAQPTRYTLVIRAVTALLIAGLTFLLTRAIQFGVDDGLSLPPTQLLPYLGHACEIALEGLSMGSSPACRLLMRDPHHEYGLGFVAQVLLLINLICVRRWNLHPSLRDVQKGPLSVALMFGLNAFLLSLVAQYGDSFAHSLAGAPNTLGQGLAYFFIGTPCVFGIMTLQSALYPLSVGNGGHEEQART
jgi:hypothetical protein